MFVPVCIQFKIYIQLFYEQKLNKIKMFSI